MNFTWFTKRPKDIADEEWFDLQFTPPVAQKKYNIAIPSLPKDDVQVGFTALAGHQNMLQAFNFYNHVRKVCGLKKMNNPYVLDFGGGWGRVARFFLRDTRAERIVVAETREYAIECLKETGARYTVIHNQPSPPILGLPGKLDLVFAYSVFSHLSEEYFLNWTKYFLSVLRPGGYIAFTTRGQCFIRHLENLHKNKEASHEILKGHIEQLCNELPTPEEIQKRHLAGEIQFYPIGGSAELTPSFYGETFIPKAYIEKHFPGLLVEFNEEVPSVDQSVVILRKPLA